MVAEFPFPAPSKEFCNNHPSQANWRGRRQETNSVAKFFLEILFCIHVTNQPPTLCWLRQVTDTFRISENLATRSRFTPPSRDPGEPSPRIHTVPQCMMDAMPVPRVTGARAPSPTPPCRPNDWLVRKSIGVAHTLRCNRHAKSFFFDQQSSPAEVGVRGGARPSNICSYPPMVGLRLSSRTPNPDHKGTNTIGREVREEIGWSEA